MKPFTILMGCMASLLLMVMFLNLLKPSVSVVTFDMRRVKGQFIHQLALHNASQNLVHTSSASFKRKLQAVLDAYAHERQTIILDSSFVLSSGQDVTDVITPRLVSAMRGQS